MWWMWFTGLCLLDFTAYAEDVPAGLRSVEAKASVSSASPVVLFGGTVMPASGPAIENGFVVLQAGRLVDVGSGEGPQREGATRVDVKGGFITPGLIDTHSHLGVYASPSGEAHSDGNEATRPNTPGVWAEHSVWPQDPGFQRAIAGGITTLQILPGSANLFGGRGVVLEVVPARGSRAMRFEGAPETVKMACGENPKRVYKDRGPSTRMGNVAGHRQAFYDAAEYRREWSAHRKKTEASNKRKKKSTPGKTPSVSLEKDTLVGILDGKILPQVHCYRADDMLSMLQIADEFGFSIRSFHHALEAYKIRDILAEREVSVSTWADWWGFKLEAYDGIPQNAALVSEAGGRAVIHSDSSTDIQRLNQEAAKAWHSGAAVGIDIPEEEVLRWITLNAAWTLGIDGETGSLEKGKRADVVVWDNNPFSIYSTAQQVYVNGVLRWDVTHPQVWSDFEVGQTTGREQ